MRWEDRTLKAVEQEERGDRERGSGGVCLVQGGGGGQDMVEEGDRISVTLKSKQGNEYQGSLEDGC